ncbi:Rho termination factor [Striga hermonthica]|uniref:Rho termination factor n=1 Tax=Striga hermonthica TaxID=68872 RepID=A0A9N7MSP1_STRHE|nr:Rho termination factor [Striga hermonthica]
MGGSVLYPNPPLNFPSVFSRPHLRKPIFSPKEIQIRLPSVRAVNGNSEKPRQTNTSNGSARKVEDNNVKSQSFDDGTLSSSLSPNKEQILTLFEHIQSSIAKGETQKSKSRKKKSKRTAYSNDNNMMSAESILEVLFQSRTQEKEKNMVNKGDDKLVGLQKDSPQKEKETTELKSIRPPSQFTRRSPIPRPSSPRFEVGVISGRFVSTDNEDSKKVDKFEEMKSIPKYKVGSVNGRFVSTDKEEDSKEVEKFEEMKLAELKEVAKSKGIKGFSKMKKSELLELLISNGA